MRRRFGDVRVRVVVVVAGLGFGRCARRRCCAGLLVGDVLRGCPFCIKWRVLRGGRGSIMFGVLEDGMWSEVEVEVDSMLMLMLMLVVFAK